LAEQQKRVVTLDDLVAQLDAIRAEVSNLRDLLTQLVAQRDSVTKTKEGLDAIARSPEGSPVLFPLSSGYEALVEATPSDRNKVIIHLGADIYAKLDVAEGLKVLSEREGELNKLINEVSQRLAQLESLEAQYESVIQQAVASAQQGRTRQG
jgi:prefoldin alpha subunit